MSKREAFLDAARSENVEDFLRLIKLHKERTDPFDIGEVVEELPTEQRHTLWSRLDSLLEQVLAAVPPERWSLRPGQEDAREDGMEVDTAADRTHVMSVVEGVTLVATLSINVLQDDTYKALLACADRLHDLLGSLPVSDEPLYLHLLRLFEAWWKKGLKKKEKFGRTAFLICLQKTTAAKKSGADIQRLWALHNVLLGLDFTSEDNKQIKHLLLQCFQNVNFINHDDGQRFLVFLFRWHVSFIWMIHGVVKNQLNFFSKNVTTHIADIYFRAWKKASGDFLDEIENTCIQNLMQSAILLPRTSPVYKKVLQIVSCFHNKKSVPNVDEMLYKLYKPILWRALSAPNYEVRANATFLFTDAFVIHDPSESSEKIDETIQKQLDMLMGLLDDVHPRVRSTATLGVCKILAKFWEVLPPDVITDFMKKLLDLAADASCPDVRGTVLKCVAIILDNPLSHPLMEKLLPTLKYSIHDKSEKVRVAFLDLLIKVKAVRAAKFWDVCKMEHLLVRLVSDSPPVSKRIVNLIFKSFFPVNESDKVWCVRCVSFLQTNGKAARKFYHYAHLYTAPTNIVKLILAIRRILNKCVVEHGDMSELNETNKENSIGENPLSVGDIALVAGLLEVVVILWRSVKKSLEKNVESQEYTTGKFSRVMAKYFHVFTDERCTVALTFLASLMPPASVPTFSGGVLSRLRRMESGALPSDFSHIIDCLCGWGQAHDIIQLVTDWLAKALSDKTASKDDNRHAVRFQETEVAKPELALAYLEYLLSRKLTREGVLLNHGPLRQLHKVLEAWRSVLCAHLRSTEEMDPAYPTVETALKALTLHGRLSIHLQHYASEGRDFLQSIEHMASWVTQRVLPLLARHNEGDETEPDAQLDLARQTVEIFLTVCRDAVLLLGDEEFKFQILHLCSGILQTEKGCLCVSLVLCVLTEMARTDVPETSEDQRDPATVNLRVVDSIFHKILGLLSLRLRKDPEGGKELCDSLVPGLVDFLQVVQTSEGNPSNPLNDLIFSTVFAAVIVESQYVLQKISHPEGVIIPETVEELRPVFGILMTAVLKAPDVTRTFLTKIALSLESEPIDSLIDLAAVLHILSVISHTGKSKAGLKRAALSLNRKLQAHSAITANQDGDIPRAIYASAVKKLNDILDIPSSL